MKPAIFTVYIDDNSHYQDESARRKLGDFSSWETAVAAAKAVVDEFLTSALKPGTTATSLLSTYKTYGEDPFVVGESDETFSAWSYAEVRCGELCSKHTKEDTK